MEHLKLLIFACPKPFVEPFINIQQNAVQSWKHMKHPHISTSIYLVGDEEGVAEYSHSLQVTHIPDIKKNDYGTPLVDDLFKTIKHISRKYQSVHPRQKVVCCYINADIITFDEMLHNIYLFHNTPIDTFKKDCGYANPDKYLLVGMRWDTDHIDYIDFNDTQWRNKIQKNALDTGKSHGCGGIDYFIFSTNTFGYIYPFALGKFVWDRWLVGNIFRQDSITVDITQTNFVIHQNGDWYQTSTGGATNNRKQLFDTDEVKINQSFDYYEKDINTGTQWETIHDKNNNLLFQYKTYVPRSD